MPLFKDAHKSWKQGIILPAERKFQLLGIGIIFIILLCGLFILPTSADEIDWLKNEKMKFAISNPAEFRKIYFSSSPIITISGIYYPCIICGKIQKNHWAGYSGIQPLCKECFEIISRERLLYTLSKPEKISDKEWWIHREKEIRGIKLGLLKEQLDTFEKVGKGDGKIWTSGIHWVFPYKDKNGSIQRTPTAIWLTNDEYNQLKNKKEVTIKFKDCLITLFLEGKYEVSDDYIYGYDVLE